MAIWNPKANDVFLQALEIEPGERRQTYLDQACRDDATLRGQVESLLAASERAGNFLEQPAAGTDATVGFGLSEAPGSSIGPYKLLQKLGEGGMGIVWAAQQTEPVKRKVALKVIKPGMDSAQVLRRFEAERQALALMDHSNIAKVLDAGLVDRSLRERGSENPLAEREVYGGRPYFVMELVKGVPITKYCDELHLPLRERLALFVPVCQAAQHAHQKGIIHRDIKPSNVLIAMQDGKPVPKVIDFGVAKALHQKLTEHTMNTEIGQVMGTLEYMSPEQAELSPLDIDTRTDIYALGVLLYELLTGTTPLDHQRLKRAGYAEVLRLIREVEPPKPSTRLSESKESLAALAAQRRTEPARLTKDVRGELDWIVMKCLEKDRTRRYETANALVRDIERHLNDEPVEACPPSRGYRLSKFLRRHKGPVAAAALVLLSLLGGVVGTTLGLVEARRQRDAADLARANEADERAKAEAQREAARQAQANAERERTRAEALQQAEERQREQAEENLRRANENFAKAEENLRMAQASFDLARRAVDHYLTKVGSDERLAEAGLVGLRKELLADAKEFYQEFVRAHDDDPNLLTDLAWAYFRMGYISDQAGAPQEAQENYRAATEAFDRLHDWAATLHEKWHVERKIDLGWLKFSWTHDFSKGVNREAEFANAMAKCYNNVGTVHYAAREWEQAEAAFRKAEALNRPLAAEQPNEAMFLLELGHHVGNLGNVFHATLRWDLAQTAYAETIELRRKLVEGHADVPAYLDDLATSLERLGQLLDQRQKYAEARMLLQEAIELRRRLCREKPQQAEWQHSLAAAWGYLAKCRFDEGRLDEALDAAREGREVRETLAAREPKPAYRQALAEAQNQIAHWSFAAGRLDAAENAWRKSFELYSRLADETPENDTYAVFAGGTSSNLGLVLFKTGKVSEAIACYDEAIRRLSPRADLPQAREYLANAHDGRARAMLAGGQEALAEQDLRRWVELDDIQSGVDDSNGRSDPDVLAVAAACRAGELSAAEERGDDALRWFVEALDRFAALADPQRAGEQAKRWRLRTREGYAQILTKLTRHAEAAEQLQLAFTDARPSHWASLTTKLAAALWLTGNAQRNDGRYDEAYQTFSRALRAVEALPEADQHEGQARQTMCIARIGRATTLSELGRHDEALAECDAACAIADGLLVDLAAALRAVTLARLGRHVEAAALNETIAQRPNVINEVLLELARAYLFAASAAASDESLDDAEKRQRHEQHLAAAVALIERARAAGYFDEREKAEALKTHEEFSVLRSRDDFQRVLDKLGGDDEPRSPGD